MGRYAVLEMIGAGSMGVVLRAYDPRLQREVAIKQLRADALDERAADRMLREAQVMAQLAHPNVVAVHDVEVLDATVLLIMEYVEGQTLGGWLGTRPPWPRIVETFVQAGRGLAAAHEAGLVHRDFKPDNVLVGRDGRVRVTDFGLARAVQEAGLPLAPPDRRDPDRIHESLSASMTVDGAVMGTPIYMAPEQHLGEGTGAPADQFSFCVALWEALAAERPYTGDYEAIARAKLSGPPALPRELTVPREVADAIARGLAPEPEDRWPSMAQLLGVLDRDRSRSRLRWVAAAAVGVAAVATTLAIVGGPSAETCVGAREHLQGIWDPPRRTEVIESLHATGLKYAEATSAQVVRALDVHADAWVHTHTDACEATSVRAEQSAEVLDLRMACLERQRIQLEATVEVLADADPHVVERAISLVTGLPAPSRCSSADALRSVSSQPEDPEQAAAVELARHVLARARARRLAGRHQAALELVEQVTASALEHPPLHVAATAEQGRILLDLGRYDEAERALTATYPEAIHHDQLADSVQMVSLLAFVIGARQMREAESRWLGQAALAMAQRLDDPRVIAIVRNDLGGVLETHAHFAEAFEHFEHVLHLQRQLFGDGPSLPVASTLANLALAARRSGDFDRAFALREQELEIELAVLGQEHPEIARSLQAVGHLLHLRGDYPQSRQYLERALDLRQRLLGPEHPETANTMASLGTTLTALGLHDEAERQLRASLTLLERLLGTDTLEVTDARNNLALEVEAQGRYEEALRLHRRSLDSLERTLGPDHPRTATALNNVGGALVALGRELQALPLLVRAVEVINAQPGPAHPHAAVFEFNVGDALFRLHRYEQAEPILRRTLHTMEQAYGPEHVYTSYPMVVLGQLLHARGDDPSAVRELLERGLELRTIHSAPQADQAEAAFALARALGVDPSQCDRARDLARQARGWFASSGPGHTADRDAADAWLRDQCDRG